MYKPCDIDKMLDASVVLVDTRENERTEAYRQRIDDIGINCERRALSFGDYSCYTVDPDGNEINLQNVVAIERKQGLSELAQNFTGGRDRFIREFERAAAAGCRLHLLIENDNYERLRWHKYKSKLSPQSYIASLLTWCARYNTQIHFCKPETSGWLIKHILRYELREYLLSGNSFDAEVTT